MLSPPQEFISFAVGLSTSPRPHLQISSQSPGGPGHAGRATATPRCPACLLGPPVKDQINWPLFEARVGLGGFLPFLPPPFFLAATSLWNRGRPGQPREAAFLWVPGGSSAEPQGLRHTQRNPQTSLPLILLSLSLFLSLGHPPGSPSTHTQIHPGLVLGQERADPHTNTRTHPLLVTQARPGSPRPCQFSLSRPLSHNPRRAGWPPLAPLIPPDAPRLAASWPRRPGSRPQRAKGRRCSPPPGAPYSLLRP